MTTNNTRRPFQERLAEEPMKKVTITLSGNEQIQFCAKPIGQTKDGLFLRYALNGDVSSTFYVRKDMLVLYMEECISDEEYNAFLTAEREATAEVQNNTVTMDALPDGTFAPSEDVNE